MAFQRAVVGERERGVQRGLPAHGRQQGVRRLGGDDPCHDLGRDRLDVGGVGELGVGHDRRRVRVHQDHPVALVLERLAGLRARIVELAGLADHDGAGPDHHDRGDVAAAGHRAAAGRQPIDATKRAKRCAGILRAGRGFRVVLDREDRPAVDGEAFQRAVEEGDVGGRDAAGQRAGRDLETVVLAGDLDPPCRQLLDRMVGAAVAEGHLPGLGAKREGEQLVAEADAEERQPAGYQPLDDRHGIDARRGGVSRPVGEKDAVRLVREDRLGVRRRGHDGHPAACRCQRAQDVPLGAVIDRHDMAARRGLGAVAAGLRVPGGLRPVIGLAAADLAREVHAFEPRPGAGLGDERRLVDRLRPRRVCQRPVLRAAAAQQAGQPPGIDTGDADEAAALQPAFEMLRRAPVRRLGDIGAEHQSKRRRSRGLLVVVVGADIADMGKGEGDDLPGIGRIGQNFLVAAHRGVEADFAHGLAACAEAAAAKDRSVGERERRSGGGGSGPGHRVSCGPAAPCRRPVRSVVRRV